MRLLVHGDDAARALESLRLRNSADGAFLLWCQLVVADQVVGGAAVYNERSFGGVDGMARGSGSWSSSQDPLF